MADEVISPSPVVSSDPVPPVTGAVAPEPTAAAVATPTPEPVSAAPLPAAVPPPTPSMTQAEMAQAVALGIAQATRATPQAQPGRALGREKFSMDQLIEAKHDDQLTSPQRIAIDREMETRRQEDLVMTAQFVQNATTTKTRQEAKVLADYPQMLDEQSPLAIQARLLQQSGVNIEIAVKAAAQELGITPASRVRPPVVGTTPGPIQQAQAAAAAMPRGAGRAVPAGAEPDWSTATDKDLEAEVVRMRGY